MSEMNNEIDNETLARIFHKAYERLAPQFGYETRRDTREFDPSTPNGRLMIAVCGEVRRALRAADLVPAQRLRDAEAHAERLEAVLRESRSELTQLWEDTLSCVSVITERGEREVSNDEDNQELHRLSKLIDKCDGALAPQHNVPRTVYELWESVERNQCDGCARGLPIDEHGIHRGEGYDVIVCTADRYTSAESGGDHE